LKQTHFAFFGLLLAAVLCAAQSATQNQNPDPSDPTSHGPNPSPVVALSLEPSETALPDAPGAQQSSSAEHSAASRPGNDAKQSDANAADQTTPPANTGARAGQQQPKRILGIMPNFRAVSAGAHPPPPTPKQSFIIATKNSFDYSSFVFVGVTSLLAEATNAHAQLGKGPGGFWNYYWRGYLDKTDGNYLVIFALPSILHQDERYYAKGEGGFWKRGIYAASRILITPDYHGNETFNASEIFGRGMAQGISLAYYPSGTRTASALSQKYAYALGRDALTNVFREFWPDIATHVLHRHP